jgi:hypothetical protein
MENEWEELFSEKHQKKYWKNKATGKTSWKDPKVSNVNNAGETESKEEKPKDNDEWEELFSEKHKKKYWKNKVTGKTSWTAPTESSKDVEKPAPIDGKSSSSVGIESEWVECFSEKHNKKYWKHKVTGKTSWKPPEKSSFISTASTSTALTNAPANSQGGEWEELFSEKHKKKYWKNKDTGATSWKKPFVAPAKEAEPTVAQKDENPVSSAVDLWEEVFSEKHNRKYWKNKESGKISWTKPAVSDGTQDTTPAPTPSNVPTASSSSNSVSEWEELYNEKHKRKYWKNKITGKVSWNNPVSEEDSNVSQKPSADKQDKIEVTVVTAPKIEPLIRLMSFLAIIKFSSCEEESKIIEIKVSADNRHSVVLHNFDFDNKLLISSEIFDESKAFKAFQVVSIQSIILGEVRHLSLF